MLSRPLPRNQPLDRHPPEILAKVLEDAVFERVERRPIDMPALGGDDVMAARPPEQARNAEAGTRTDDADDAGVRQIVLGTAHMPISARIKTGDGMRDRRKIVDDDEAARRPGALPSARAGSPKDCW